MNTGKLARALGELGRVLSDEPLYNYTTFKTGGPADILFMPGGRERAAEAVALIREEGAPLTVIGGGSNLLVSDSGVRGVVMRICDGDDGASIPAIRADGLVAASAGTGKKSQLRYCMEEGFTGMEFMAGIPGCVGGGIVMNAGTVDGTFAGVLAEVEYLDGAGAFTRVAVDAGVAGYRSLGLPSSAVVLEGVFRLNRGADRNEVEARIRRIIAERKAKHPLDYPSAGSVFKNPPGHSSWKLIRDAGLNGARVGGAMVSGMHTNFIINYDNATSSDILNLISLVQERVYGMFTVRLEPEVRMLGTFGQ
jgi:UDP-N-acetylmuramate dehydrogenase